ncbi:ATP-binding cassette domain-containing protein [Facklamia sp. P12945]|uniref:ATP-binding cassette domain-containing protein n=1 Tax=unclassified Facklamia TaxID=2622293 RepID=UPI003D170B87
MNPEFHSLIIRLKPKNFINILILSVVMALLSLAPIKLVEHMIDSINTDLKQVILSGVILLVVFFLSAIIEAYKNVYAEGLSLNFSNQLRKDILKRFLNLSFQQQKTYRTETQSASILEDVKIVSDSSIKPLSDLIGSISSFVISVILVFSISPYIMLVLLLVGLISIYVNNWFMKRYEQLIDESRISSDRIWKLFNDINLYFEEILTNNRVQRFEKLTEEESDLFKKHHFEETRFTQKIYVVDTIIFMSTIGILYIITSILVYFNQMTIGGMVAIMMYNSILIDPLIDFSKAIKEWRRVIVSLKRLDKIPKNEVYSNRKELTFKNKITFQKVSFLDNEKKILDNISFEIKRGDKVAIIGKSGSGKSTILRMILGLIQPTKGEVLFDGNSVTNELDVTNNFSVLTQECIIVPDSLLANLELYVDKVETDDLGRLINQLELNKVLSIENLEDPVTFSSGGENKRIGLLRTFLRKAPIYIFDELSNSLDDENLEKTLHYIKNNLSDKTIIMVDHRFKDKTFFDKIIYLEDGQII